MPARILMLFAAGLLWVGAALAQININTASQEQLDGLKGIGPGRARAIVDYRQKNGPFHSLDELLNVPGIGEKILQGLRRDVVVGGVGPAPEVVAIQENRRQLAPARPGAASGPAPARSAKPAAPPAKHDASAVPARSVGESRAPAAAPAPARPAMSKPAELPAKHDAPAAPARPVGESRAPVAAPAAPARPAVPAAPARPMRASPAPQAVAKPAAAPPATPQAKPAAPARPAMPAVKPAAPATPVKPAAPARPAQPVVRN